MSQPQEEKEGKENNLLENAAHGSPAMTIAEVCSSKKNKSRKRWEKRQNATESNVNISGFPKDTFSTETSTVALNVPPKHPVQCTMYPVMRQSLAENEGKDKDMLENAANGSPAMTSEEVSLRNKNKRRKRQERRHGAVESNCNLSCVPKDIVSNETSTVSLAMSPQHPAQYSADPVSRQSQAENKGKEKNVLVNAADGSSAMISEEVNLKKKNKRRKRQENRHNAIDSNGNLSGILKDTFSTETSTAALAVPPQYWPQYSRDPVTRQSQAESEGKEKNVLKNATDGSAAIICEEVSVRKKNKRKRQEKRHNAIESNGNPSGVPKDTFSTETSTAALAVPPQNQPHYSVDPVTRQSQEENEGKEKNVLENATNGSAAMISEEVRVRKKNKRRKRQEKRHNTIESNGNPSGDPKDTFSTETSTAALAVPPQNQPHYSVDPVTRQSQEENEGKEKNVLENATNGSAAMISEVRVRKKNKRRKRQEKRHNTIESNGNPSGVPKDTFSTETSTAALAVPPQNQPHYSVDPVMRQSQAENEGKEKNALENATDGSAAMISEEVSVRKKNKRRKRQEKRHNAIESNGNPSGDPKDTFSTETSTAALSVPPQNQPHYSVDPVTRQSQAENEGKEKNVLENATDGSAAIISEEVSVRKKNKRRKRQEKRHNAIESNDDLSGVLKGTFSTETSTAALAVPPQNQPHYSVDPVTRQSQAENEGKEKNVLENATDGSAAIISEEVSVRKKNKRRKRQEKRHNAIESNDDLSGVLKDTFSTETSTASLAVPPQHQPQYSVDPVMRLALVENEGKEKNVLENAADGSSAMTSAEVSLRKKNKRRKRKEKRHNAIESSGNLSGVPKDTFSTETSTASLAVPPHQPQYSVDPLMRQSLVENEGKEKSVLETATDGSGSMTSAEVSLRKKNKRRRHERRHNAIESSGNLSGVPKDTFSTETSAAALAVPPHQPQYSVDPLMRQSPVENEGKEKSVLETATDGSATLTSAEVSLRNNKRRHERRHNAIESSGNLSCAPKDIFSAETSTAALAMPPQHPAQHYVDPIMSQSQPENEGKDNNMLENAADGFPAMISEEVRSRKKNKERKRLESRHNAIESNGDLSVVPKDTFSTETSRPSLDMTSQHPAQYSMDPVMRHCQGENEGEEQNMSEKAQAMANAEVNSGKKNKNRKRRKTRLNDINSNINPSGAPPETCTPTLDMPPQDPAQYLMDPVKRQCQEENELKEPNMLEKSTNGSSALTSAELNSRKKERRKRQKTRHNAIQSSVTLSGVPGNTISTATCTPALDMLSQQPAQCLSMAPVMRHFLEENEGKEQNVLDKAAESNNAEHNLEMKNGNPGSVVANAEHFEKEFMSEVVNAVQVDSVQMLEMEVSKDQGSLNPGAAFEEMKLMTENSCQQRFVTVVDFPEVQPEEKNDRKLDFQVTRHDMSSAGDIADLSLVSKQDGGSSISLFSPGRTITNHSKKKLLVLDLNGLLADFVPSVREGYKPDIKISDKKVFKRPFCEDFLRFCFDRFHVGIWSSRTGKNVATAIKFLVGEFASKLLFRWNNYHCTRTKFRTIDKKKLIFLKELRKLWEKLKPGLPWEKGEFNESNTLLLDDSPYKALRNPMYTGIFPYPYQYFDTNDTSLGREGDLRVYLEGLAMADNVQEYVASHPFGQPAITESNPHWDLYKRVRGAAKCDAATSKP